MKEKEYPGNGRRPMKIIFPIGVFFMLFFIESLVAAGASLAYFFYVGKSGISDIESNVRSCSIPIAEAFGTMAEMCYRSRDYRRLRTLFREKIEQNSIDEAFFVLRNGKLIAHTDPSALADLKGNIASDELAYNMDLILRPVVQKSRDVFFTDYNIVSRRAPFRRELRMLLKSYFYRNIDSTGWLVSRAVYGRKKPVGAVCFIISKQRIYCFLAAHVERSLRIFMISLAVAGTISLLVSLVVLARYRSIQKRSSPASGMSGAPRGSATAGGFYDMTMPPGASEEEPVVVELVGAAEGDGGGTAGASPFHLTREIKDAIPAGK